MFTVKQKSFIVICILFVSYAYAADDGISRFQSLKEYITAFNNNNHSLSIDKLVIKLTLNKECQVRQANYLSDGTRNKMEEKKYISSTMNEAWKKSENSDNELPLVSKHVWTKTRMYESYGDEKILPVQSYAISDPMYSYDGNPVSPFLKFDKIAERLIKILSTSEYTQVNILKDTTSDGKNVKELYLVEKKTNGEVFDRFYFSPDSKLVWPLLYEYGFRFKDKDIVTCRMQFDANAESPLGYMGFNVEYFVMDDAFNQACMALEKKSQNGEKIDKSTVPEPKPSTQTKTQIIFMNTPDLGRSIPEGDFDFLIPKGGIYKFFSDTSLSNAQIISVTDKDYVVRPE